jgi:hypothetical protein
MRFKLEGMLRIRSVHGLGWSSDRGGAQVERKGQEAELALDNLVGSEY